MRVGGRRAAILQAPPPLGDDRVPQPPFLTPFGPVTAAAPQRSPTSSTIVVSPNILMGGYFIGAPTQQR